MAAAAFNVTTTPPLFSLVIYIYIFHYLNLIDVEFIFIN
jgi:hypothetical protein